MDDTAAMRKLAQMMLIICVRCVTFLARYCDHNEAAVFPLLSGGWCEASRRAGPRSAAHSGHRHRATSCSDHALDTGHGAWMAAPAEQELPCQCSV